MDTLIPLLAILVVQHSVPVKESTATRVLSNKADRLALMKQGGIGKIFRHSPIEWELALGHQLAIRHDLLNARMQLEIGRNRSDFAP